MNLFRRVLPMAIVLACALPSVATAQSSAAALGQASIEELLDVRVTSVARRGQRVEDAAAAVYVITASDIRRSGLSTLPEILRLAPGVQVARVSAGKWAVSIRGFNDVYSNKLLVLVDGRSVYSRTFSGVFWDMQDLIVSDIERIEVIRGPGGATWGSNAVNGVINVITRPATDTTGLAITASAGTFTRGRVGLRYGASRGDTSFRVFSQWSGWADSDADAVPAFRDRWHSLTGGARLDWSHGVNAVLAQGHVTQTTTRPGWFELTSTMPGAALRTDGVTDALAGSVLGRWTRTSATGSVLQAQAYHTTTRRDESIVSLLEHASDLDVQWQTTVGSRHGVVVGGGLRRVSVSADSTLTLHLGSARIHTFNAFAQDEITLRRGLTLSLGVKTDHDTFGGWNVMPSGRVIWEATSSQRVWGAVSRARRAPAITDRDFRLNLSVQDQSGLPLMLGVIGNADFSSETFVQVEAGYRLRLGSGAALEATAFRGTYDGLSSLQPFAPIVELSPPPVHVFAGVRFENLLEARTRGIELNAHLAPRHWWSVDASYSFLDLDTRAAGSPAIDTPSGSAPRHQWQLRTALTPHVDVQFGASLFHVGTLQQAGVPAYTRLDLRGEVRLTDALSLAVVGQNLLERQHREFASDNLSLYLTSTVPRSARIDLRWSLSGR